MIKLKHEICDIVRKSGSGPKSAPQFKSPIGEHLWCYYILTIQSAAKLFEHLIIRDKKLIPNAIL